jgi:hypothetical protein
VERVIRKAGGINDPVRRSQKHGSGIDARIASEGSRIETRTIAVSSNRAEPPEEEEEGFDAARGQRQAVPNHFFESAV